MKGKLEKLNNNLCGPLSSFCFLDPAKCTCLRELIAIVQLELPATMSPPRIDDQDACPHSYLMRQYNRETGKRDLGYVCQSCGAGEARMSAKLTAVKAGDVMQAAEAWVDAARKELTQHQEHRLYNSGTSAQIAESIFAQTVAAFETRKDVEIERLRTALLQGAKWFKEYAEGHAAKGASEKATRNYERERFLREAVSIRG